jgi:hypothetical protein
LLVNLQSEILKTLANKPTSTNRATGSEIAGLLLLVGSWFWSIPNCNTISNHYADTEDDVFLPRSHHGIHQISKIYCGKILLYENKPRYTSINMQRINQDLMIYGVLS